MLTKLGNYQDDRIDAGIYESIMVPPPVGNFTWGMSSTNNTSNNPIYKEIGLRLYIRTTKNTDNHKGMMVAVIAIHYGFNR